MNSYQYFQWKYWASLSSPQGVLPFHGNNPYALTWSSSSHITNLSPSPLPSKFSLLTLFGFWCLNTPQIHYSSFPQSNTLHQAAVIKAPQIGMISLLLTTLTENKNALFTLFECQQSTQSSSLFLLPWHPRNCMPFSYCLESNTIFNNTVLSFVFKIWQGALDKTCKIFPWKSYYFGHPSF